MAKRTRKLLGEVTQLSSPGKAPLWAEGPAWANPTGPDYPPRETVNEWGIPSWHGRLKGYTVRVQAVIPHGHRAPTTAEGLAEVARRLEAGPPPAPPRPALPTAEPAEPAPTRKEAPSDYVSRILAEPSPRPLEGPTKLYDERGEDFTPQWGRFDRADY